jgi:hypothetical protein
MDYKEFLEQEIIPKYGPQPLRFRDWDKRALREFYISFLRNRFNSMKKSPELERFIREIEENILFIQ